MTAHAYIEQKCTNGLIEHVQVNMYQFLCIITVRSPSFSYHPHFSSPPSLSTSSSPTYLPLTPPCSLSVSLPCPTPTGHTPSSASLPSTPSSQPVPRQVGHALCPTTLSSIVVSLESLVPQCVNKSIVTNISVLFHNFKTTFETDQTPCDIILSPFPPPPPLPVSLLWWSSLSQTPPTHLPLRQCCLA